MTTSQAIKQIQNARVVSVPNNKNEYNLVILDNAKLINKNGNPFTFKYDESVVTKMMPRRSRRNTGR